MLQILVLFFGFSAIAESVCMLLEKNVEQRKYSFKCNNQIVNIQCAIKNATVCRVNIKEKLKSSSFDIADDQINSLNLFSNSELSKTECDSSKKLCKVNGNVCKKYEKYYEGVKEKFIDNFSQTGRCAGAFLGASIQGIGSLSGGLISDTEFKKNNCSIMSDVATDALKNKISIFKKTLDEPILDRTSFLYNCVNPSGQNTSGSQDAEVLKKTPSLLELKKAMLGKMESAEQLKDLVCGPQREIFFENENVNLDNVICAIVEESKLAISDKTIGCSRPIRRTETDRFSEQANHREASAALAKADSVPLEQKPMPEIMASQVGKPIGLTPALAQVDQAVPGSGTVQGSTPSESNIASGAVRGTFPNTAAIQAGQAFAPVYEKLSNMANAVTTSSSGRTGVIGRSNSPKPASGASGIVTVSRKVPAANSDSSIDPSSLVAASVASGTTAGLTNNSDADPKAAKAAGIQRSVANDAEVAPIGGPRAVNLGGSTSGGSRGVAANVAAGAANSEGVSSAALASVQKKITQLNTPTKVISFFKEEAVKIPDFRSLLYSDATSSLLASKGIRVVNQSGDVSGETTTKAKYVFSDDGTKFTKLNVGKKN
ncbi:MAG: hypothetical protein B7Y39_02195 [Bdellovibrio sp. 28-41-41]|nr:MAG: hypothetical protein B7Y39_02195 [Bdellovibrio sp. 28-41-41]